MRKIFQLLISSVLALAFSACATIKPYEKEYLLSPVMDDEQLGRLQSRLLQDSKSRFEKLSVGGANSGATSCPTCGG